MNSTFAAASVMHTVTERNDRRWGVVDLPRWFVPVALTTVGFLFCYQSAVREMVLTWKNDPDYSHGFFVLPLAAYVGWQRRASLKPNSRPNWWGFILIAIGLAAKAFGALYTILPIEQFSMLPTLAGCIWLLGGQRTLTWSLPLLGLLVLMIPLPYSIAVAQAAPLQQFGANCASYLLQAMGIPALAEGNTIRLERDRLNVAYACSGLQMTVAFLTVSYSIALLSKATFIGKLVIALSAIPIAVFCNVLRITGTGVAYQFFDSSAVRTAVHDFAGFAFIPIAIALLFGGMALFEKTFPVIEPRS